MEVRAISKIRLRIQEKACKDEKAEYMRNM
jgi:hypothetical protein